MGWLDDIAKWAQEHHKPFGDYAERPQAPRGYEVINLPGPSFLTGRGGKWVSSLTPHNPPQVIEVEKGNRMWDHGAFIISTAGLKPDGQLDYCDRGGCQYRAFANAGGLRQNVNEVEQEYLRAAADMGFIYDDEIGSLKGRFFDVDIGLIESLSLPRGMKTWEIEPNVGLDEAVEKIQNGVLLATNHSLGAHLVAIRDGKQVFPNFSQEIEDYNTLQFGFISPRTR